jgi:hypothetical protein
VTNGKLWCLDASLPRRSWKNWHHDECWPPAEAMDETRKASRKIHD